MAPTMEGSEQLSSRQKFSSSGEVKPVRQALPGRSRRWRLCCLLPFYFVCFFVYCGLCNGPVQLILSVIFSDVAFLSELATCALPRA